MGVSTLLLHSLGRVVKRDDLAISRDADVALIETKHLGHMSAFLKRSRHFTRTSYLLGTSPIYDLLRMLRLLSILPGEIDD